MTTNNARYLGLNFAASTVRSAWSAFMSRPGSTGMSHAHQPKQSLLAWPIHIFGVGPGQAGTLMGWLTEQGIMAKRHRKADPLSEINKLHEGSLLFIDLDAMGGIAFAADRILELRRRRTDLVVVLMSRDFSGHDFSAERLPFADASLKLPCSFAAIEEAAAEARQNNALWRKRGMNHA